MQRFATRFWLLMFALLAGGCAVARPMERIAPGALQIETTPLYDWGQIGAASFYHMDFNGRPTASGARYDDRRMTAAHRTISLGTWVRVTNLDNLKCAVVQINDRGPYVKGRIIDVSGHAARILGFTQRGIARVRIEPLS